MSDGELKKRINFVFPVDAQVDNKNWLNLEEAQNQNVTISISDIIDEAKQEFDSLEDSLTEEWFAERDSELIGKINEWFIKWFGDSS